MSGPLKATDAPLSAHPSPGGQGALKALDDLAAFCSDDTETVERHVAVIRAALSAQPSPGGQGEGLASLPLYRLADDANGIRGLHRDETGSWVKLQDVERTLAARQPVYEGHTWVSDYVLAGLRERAEMPLQLRNGEVWHWQGDGHDFPESLVCPVVMSAETLRALLAARQPVGEAVAWKYRAPGVSFWRVSFRKPVNAEWECEPLYAAPPAQAVDLDLGQFRRPIEEWRSDMEKWVKEHGDYDGVFAKDIAEANRLLALIDNQAVGNG